LTSYGTVFPYGENEVIGLDEYFYIPNLSKRVPVGFDYQATDADFDSPGNTGGAKTHTLTSAEMPSHTHTQDAHSHSVAAYGSLSGTYDRIVTDYAGGGANTAAINSTVGGISDVSGEWSAISTTATNQSTGGGGAHNNMQPYIVMHYIIKCK
jgi:microcystin-dependent protein